MSHLHVVPRPKARRLPSMRCGICGVWGTVQVGWSLPARDQVTAWLTCPNGHMTTPSPVRLDWHDPHPQEGA